MNAFRSRRDDGAATVEFALVVPLLLGLAFGIINFGIIFASQISLNSAARDAARAGVVQPLSGTGLTCAQIAVQVRTNATTIALDPSKVAVTVTAPTPTTGTAKSCTLPAGAQNLTNEVTGTGASKALCSGSRVLTNPQLTVSLSYAYNSPVPLVPPYSLNQTAVGKFQCEYA